MRITVTVDVPDHASALNHKVREALNAVRNQTVGDRLAPGSAGCVDDPDIGAIAVWEVTEDAPTEPRTIAGVLRRFGGISTRADELEAFPVDSVCGESAMEITAKASELLAIADPATHRAITDAAVQAIEIVCFG